MVKRRASPLRASAYYRAIWTLRLQLHVIRPPHVIKPRAVTKPDSLPRAAVQRLRRLRSGFSVTVQSPM